MRPGRKKTNYEKGGLKLVCFHYELDMGSHEKI